MGSCRSKTALAGLSLDLAQKPAHKTHVRFLRPVCAQDAGCYSHRDESRNDTADPVVALTRLAGGKPPGGQR